MEINEQTWERPATYIQFYSNALWKWCYMYVTEYIVDESTRDNWVRQLS